MTSDEKEDTGVRGGTRKSGHGIRDAARGIGDSRFKNGGTLKTDRHFHQRLGSLGFRWGGHFELAGCLDQYSQSLVDGLRVAEYRRHIGIEQPDVRTFLVPLVVFAANTPAEIVLWPHFVGVDLIILRTHISTPTSLSCCETGFEGDYKPCPWRVCDFPKGLVGAGKGRGGKNGLKGSEGKQPRSGNQCQVPSDK